ncbi:MAG: hypothetical protein WD851_21535 [Pirellulales bacterium]
MAGKIYLLNDSSNLMAMEESPYDSELLLQKLLAKHPDLLAGEQVDVDEPRRWLLVTREMSVPGEEDGVGKWSLDHLFLDQDAIPTLVEVKRSSDAGIRRKVVGQMLDYAANAVAYWPVEEIKAKFESRCQSHGEDPDELLMEHLGNEESTGDFWQQVKTNLQAGRIRMVFVSDTIPAELRRIVEFLNEQMDPAEVIAIEIRQFVGEGVTTLVPRVMGQTESARKKKAAGSASGRYWDEAAFMKALSEKKGAVASKTAKEILDWVTPMASYLCWGRGKRSGGVVPTVMAGKTKFQLFRLRIDGWFVFRFDWIYKKAPFTDEALRRELLNRFNEIPSVHFSDDVLTKRALIPLESLATPPALEKLKVAIEWMIEKIRTSQ